MRLLHARTFALHEFFDAQIPKYLILSHRWEEDEVSYRDIVNQNFHQKKGWKKIAYICQQALKQSIDHVWVDTCCIDKSSSVELSEAINSMWNWYRDALCCCVYLSDVSVVADPPVTQSSHSRPPLLRPNEFIQSKWFTRSWTLQELLAPVSCTFHDRNWHPIGDRTNLKEVISAGTGIAEEHLSSMFFSHVPIATRMSWAAGRQSSRAEDRAYSLMGLFGVNMPLLYGEGPLRSFHRLQHEILRNSHDESLFAWTFHKGDVFYLAHGMFADSPDQFRLPPTSPVLQLAADHREAYDMTNRGLQITLRVTRLTVMNEVVYMAYFNCSIGVSDAQMAILLSPLVESARPIDASFDNRPLECTRAGPLFLTTANNRLGTQEKRLYIRKHNSKFHHIPAVSYLRNGLGGGEEEPAFESLRYFLSNFEPLWNSE